MKLAMYHGATGSLVALAVVSVLGGSQSVPSIQEAEQFVVRREDGTIACRFGFIEHGHVGLELNGEGGRVVLMTRSDGSNPMMSFYGPEGQQTIAVAHSLIKVYGMAGGEIQLIAGAVEASAEVNLINGKQPHFVELRSDADELGLRLSGRGEASAVFEISSNQPQILLRDEDGKVLGKAHTPR